MAVRPIPRILKIILAVALVHCLLTFLLAPIGWEYLYSWNSPHWLRAIWACMFELPIRIVYGNYLVFQAPFLEIVLTPLNSLLLASMLITPIYPLMKFRLTRQRRDLIGAAAGFGVCATLLLCIGTKWIPPNIVSAREAAISNLRQIDAALHQLGMTNDASKAP